MKAIYQVERGVLKVHGGCAIPEGRRFHADPDDPTIIDDVARGRIIRVHLAEAAAQ